MIRSFIKRIIGRDDAPPAPKADYPFQYDTKKATAPKPVPVAEVPKPVLVPEPVQAAPEPAPEPEPEVIAEPVAVAEPVVVAEPVDYSAWTVKQLRAELESQGVELASRVRKAELVEMMEGLAEPTDDVQAGPALDPVVIQELLDDMVRPALQSDGGDISLIKVDGMDIHVRLVGACSTCPSSIMTMKMGVEALFREEFEGFGELIQVD